MKNDTGTPWLVWLVFAGALAGGVGVLHFYLTNPETAPPPTERPARAATPVAAAPMTATEAPPPADMPALDDSDAWLRALAAALSSNPQFAKWLTNDRLIRRFVAVIDNVAGGASPKPHLLFLEPRERFRTSGKAGRATVDPRSYARYDRVADIVESLDARGCAELYRSVKPLVTQAYRDLGYPTRNFDEKLEASMRILLAVPIVREPVEIEPARATTWRFVEPKLEALTPAQKQLLRMGPHNVERIQAKLRAIAEALALAEAAPSPWMG